jgi:hypothetical protein
VSVEVSAGTVQKLKRARDLCFQLFRIGSERLAPTPAQAPASGTLPPAET